MIASKLSKEIYLQYSSLTHVLVNIKSHTIHVDLMNIEKLCLRDVKENAYGKLQKSASSLRVVATFPTYSRELFKERNKDCKYSLAF